MYIIYFFPVQLSFCWLWPMMLDIWQCQVVVNATAPTHTHTQGFSQDKERKQTNRQIKILKSVGQSQTGVIVVGDPWKFSLDCLSNALSGATSFVQGNSWAISSSHTHINHHRKTDEIFVKIRGQGQLNFSCYLPTKLKQHLIEIIFNKSSDGWWPTCRGIRIMTMGMDIWFSAACRKY